MTTESIARDRHQRQSLGGLYDRIKEVRLSSILSQRVTNFGLSSQKFSWSELVASDVNF